MKPLKVGEGFRVLDGGASKCVVFDDGRKHVTYRKADAALPQWAEYEKGRDV